MNKKPKGPQLRTDEPGQIRAEQKTKGAEMTIKQIEEIQPEIENALIEHAEIILRSETGQKTHYISVEEVEKIIDTYLNTRFAKMRYKRKYDRN